MAALANVPTLVYHSAEIYAIQRAVSDFRPEIIVAHAPGRERAQQLASNIVQAVERCLVAGGSLTQLPYLLFSANIERDPRRDRALRGYLRQFWSLGPRYQVAWPRLFCGQFDLNAYADVKRFIVAARSAWEANSIPTRRLKDRNFCVSAGLARVHGEGAEIHACLANEPGSLLQLTSRIAGLRLEPAPNARPMTHALSFDSVKQVELGETRGAISMMQLSGYVDLHLGHAVIATHEEGVPSKMPRAYVRDLGVYSAKGHSPQPSLAFGPLFAISPDRMLCDDVWAACDRIRSGCPGVPVCGVSCHQDTLIARNSPYIREGQMSLPLMAERYYCEKSAWWSTLLSRRPEVPVVRAKIFLCWRSRVDVPGSLAAVLASLLGYQAVPDWDVPADRSVFNVSYLREAACENGRFASVRLVGTYASTKKTIQILKKELRAGTDAEYLKDEVLCGLELTPISRGGLEGQVAVAVWNGYLEQLRKSLQSVQGPASTREFDLSSVEAATGERKFILRQTTRGQGLGANQN
jgi:hypothetical protein